MLSSEILLYYIIVFILLENTFEIILSWRQVRVYKTSKQLPAQLSKVMDQKTFEKARIYGLDKEQFNIFKAIIMNIFLLTAELYFGILAKCWTYSKQWTGDLGLDADNEYFVSGVFMSVMSVYGLIKDMPFKVYGTFVLEEKHGFNKQTAGFFIKDTIKSFVLSNVLMIPIGAAIIFIVNLGGDFFFVWLWAFLSVVMLALLTIYPTFIAPLFDKYRPLEEGVLRSSIEKLAASLKFPLTQLYVVEGSKRSAHSNAYFYGLWKSKRIVLFDTLLKNKGIAAKETEEVAKENDAINSDKSDAKNEDDSNKGCEDSEVLAVLAHELGHWKLGHVTKNIIIGQVHLFLMFAAFGYLFKFDTLYHAIGLEGNEKPILIGMIVIFNYIMSAYNAVISFSMTVLSRKFEYEADAFAQELGYGDELCKGLVKLNIDNLGFPVYDWLYSTWNHSHPTILQRMDRLSEIKKKAK